ncbi:hypothetical protein DRO59_03615 [Candidatus Bathyarchaeota archaeon]|nr:MAG: hypothetical protein DRO59_03615 [Candidatus Bathyarchaeota archaeon]
MSKGKPKDKVKTSAKFDLTSKFWKTFLTLLAVFLIFVGPTYIVYVLIKILEIDFFISMGSGFTLFIIGLALLCFLIKKKVISE